MKSLASDGPTQALAAGQRVIVFKDHPESGGTLGYYGTIVRVHTASIRRHPSHPDQWVYSVYVRHFGACVDVAAADLFATGDVDSSDLPLFPEGTDAACEVRFHSKMLPDNPAIEGAYRPPGREWRLFTFRKCAEACPGYELTHPVPPHSSQFPTLSYRVPLKDRLDRSFVLRAIAELIGVEWVD